MKNAKTIEDKNILKSHDYYNASHEIINAYAYINDKGIIPAGSPYPYYDIGGVNNIRHSDLKSSYFPTSGSNLGSTYFVGDYGKIRFINFSQMTRTIQNVSNPLSTDHDMLEIKVVSPNTTHASGSGQIDLFFDLETTVPEGTTINISFDIQLDTTNATVKPSYAGFVYPLEKEFASPDWEGSLTFTDWVSFTPINGQEERIKLTMTTTVDNKNFFLQVPFDYQDQTNISLKLGRVQMSIGTVEPPYSPSPSDGGTAPSPDGIPEGVIFHDIDANENITRHRADVIMVNGKILESRLPVPITTEQKLALKMKGIQVL